MTSIVILLDYDYLTKAAAQLRLGFFYAQRPFPSAAPRPSERTKNVRVSPKRFARAAAPPPAVGLPSVLVGGRFLPAAFLWRKAPRPISPLCVAGHGRRCYRDCKRTDDGAPPPPKSGALSGAPPNRMAPTFRLRYTAEQG